MNSVNFEAIRNINVYKFYSGPGSMSMKNCQGYFSLFKKVAKSQKKKDTIVMF